MMIGGLGFFVTLWLGGFWQGWQWNNPSIPFIDTVVALKPIWLVRFFSGVADLLRDRRVRVQHHGHGGRGGASVCCSKADQQLADCRAFVGRAGPVLHRRPADHGRAAAGRQELGPLREHDPPRAYRKLALHRQSAARAAPSMSAKAAGTATRSRPARWSPTPNARGWRGVDSPVSTPDEFVYDSPHMFGTKRTGPDLSRVGGKYDTQWHRTHFRNPRDLVPGSVMPPFPWIVEQPAGIHGAGGLSANARAAPRTGGPTRTTRNDGDYTWPSIYFAYLFFAISLGVAVFFFVRSLQGRVLEQGQPKKSRYQDASRMDTCNRLKPKIKEYAGGWITEREGTEIPAS